MTDAKIIKLEPGLYLVATPIGTARDITLRALDVLASADVIAAEDTRTARKLMDIHGVRLGDRPLVAYHDHSSAGAREAIAEHVTQGRSVAYVSEAGTPMIADPGYHLVETVRGAGHKVVSVPGPSAVVTALTVGGLPTDRFFFAGFLPNTSNARKTYLEELRDVPGTLVFYESPKRIVKCLADMVEVLGPDRQASVCRELTKKFEEVIGATLSELHSTLQNRTLKGELVVLVDRPRGTRDTGDFEGALAQALETMRTRDAADAVAASFGLPRRQVYQKALELAALAKDRT
jgi:16S rRNA (cytidine1402-2'-O)-methyltransferase